MPDLRGETPMKLMAGERFRLSDENKYIRMISGRLEVYAVTRKNVSFRQIFLMELNHLL